MKDDNLENTRNGHSIYYKNLADITSYSRDYNKIKDLIMDMEENIKTNPLKIRFDKYGQLRNQALVNLLFITGGRISEILDIDMKPNADKIFKREDFLYFTIPTKKKRNLKDNSRVIPIHIKGEKWALDPIVKYYNLRQLELKKKIEGGWGDWLLRKPKRLKLFPICRMYAYDILTWGIGMNPHALRKIRTTLLMNNMGFNIPKLMRINGWSSPDSLKPYMNINTIELEKSIIENIDNFIGVEK